MTPFECYNEYMALKNHFCRDSYDYFKYNGKSRLKLDSFEKRKDKLFFQKLAKHPDLHNFLVANFSVNSKAWIRELAYSDDAEKIYKDWNRRQQSLSYCIKQDLSKLNEKFDDNFICAENKHPILLQKYLGQEICLETLCILLKLTGAKKYWDKKMEYDLIWCEIKIQVEKYTPFIKYEEEKLKKIVLDFFTQ
ncbi:59 protein [uncultured Caudovirales phage]|uniref:59 protein n=1 Tax=uncultured Caudovirales phage TaxID=2100421 RepID=A0A6J5NUS5_9CAUD|nr:59 protein [uncultured Caudovirales phage]